MENTYIYLVVEYFNNGEICEEQDDYTNIIRAFPTVEEADQFIKELDIPVADYPKDEMYFEVFVGDEMFKYAVYGDQFRRYFLHEVEGYRVYETLAYFIRRVPFGKER